MSKFALVLVGLAMLLAGCGGPLTGDADAGPNPQAATRLLPFVT
jgi:hypothetical protein